MISLELHAPSRLAWCVLDCAHFAGAQPWGMRDVSLSAAQCITHNKPEGGTDWGKAVICF